MKPFQEQREGNGQEVVFQERELLTTTASAGSAVGGTDR